MYMSLVGSVSRCMGVECRLARSIYINGSNNHLIHSEPQCLQHAVYCMMLPTGTRLLSAVSEQ